MYELPKKLKVDLLSYGVHPNVVDQLEECEFDDDILEAFEDSFAQVRIDDIDLIVSHCFMNRGYEITADEIRLLFDAAIRKMDLYIIIPIMNESYYKAHSIVHDLFIDD